MPSFTTLSLIFPDLFHTSVTDAESEISHSSHDSHDVTRRSRDTDSNKADDESTSDDAFCDDDDYNNNTISRSISPCASDVERTGETSENDSDNAESEHSLQSESAVDNSVDVEGHEINVKKALIPFGGVRQDSTETRSSSPSHVTPSPPPSPPLRPRFERRSRRKPYEYTEKQRKELEAEFMKSPYCPRGRKVQIGLRLQLLPDAVITFFTNTRNKLRRRIAHDTSALVPYRAVTHPALAVRQRNLTV